MATVTIEALRSKQRRTDPPFGGELSEANVLAGIQPIIMDVIDNEPITVLSLKNIIFSFSSFRASE